MVKHQPSTISEGNFKLANICVQGAARCYEVICEKAEKGILEDDDLSESANSQTPPGRDGGVGARQPGLTSFSPTLPKYRTGVLGRSTGPQLEKANFLPKSVMLQRGLFRSAGQKPLLY